MSKKQTLLEKFGGSTCIHEMAFGFHQRLLRDQYLRRYFRYLDIDDFVVLHQEFFEIALGRTQTQNENVLKTVRQSFIVDETNFSRFVQHILDTLEKNGLADKDRQQVVSRIAAYIQTLTGKDTFLEINGKRKKQSKENQSTKNNKEDYYEGCSV